MFFWLIIFAGIGYYITKYRMHLEGINVLIGTIGLPIAVILVLRMLFGLNGQLGTLLLLVVFGLAGYLFYIKNEDLREWLNHDFSYLTPSEFSQRVAEVLVKNDVDPSTYNLETEKSPQNRLNYFLDSDFNDEEIGPFPVVYNIQPADNEFVFREYGYVITAVAITIKRQIHSKNKNEKYTVKKLVFKLHGIYKVELKNQKLILFYSDKTVRTIEAGESTMILYLVIQEAIRDGWTKLNEEVIQKIEVINGQNKHSELNDHIDQAMREYNNEKVTQNMSGISGINVASDIKKNQINDRFSNGGQGHGHVGEQMGDTFDGLKMKFTKREGATHLKDGADRVVNGRNIQTKYYKNAHESIKAGFNKDGTAKYVVNGRMMQIEVPRDQYNAAIKEMEHRISNGEVPGEKPENTQNASKYVRRGALTREQAEIATKTIFDRGYDENGKDVLLYKKRNPKGKIVGEQRATLWERAVYSAGGDFLTGVKSGIPVATVTSVWILCNDLWSGQDADVAIEDAFSTSGKVLLSSGGMYMLTSQIAGTKAVQRNVNQTIGKVLGKEFSKEAIGMGISTGLMAVITLGPDIAYIAVGKISMKQLVKDTTTFGVSTALAIGAGSLLGPWGAAVAGLGSYAVTKMTMDHFMEDDAVLMTRILKEEVIETLFYAPLTSDEYELIQSAIFEKKQTPKILRSMYASGQPREYIHKLFLGMIMDQIRLRPLDDELIIDVIHSISA